MNIASIDIGTNTILLLIAKVTDSKIIPLHNEYRIPRIGKGIKANHPITQDKIEIFIKILIEYKEIIDSYNCELVIANATNAMRLASNSKEIIEMVFNKTGFMINIISGEEEAKLSFLGAASINDSNDIFLVIDIGGGSTEIIYGQNKKIIFSKSFQIGAVSLTEKYFKHNPPFKEEILNALNDINQVFEELNNLSYKPIKAIGIAGTPTTLAAINLSLPFFDEEKIEGTLLNIEELEKHIKLLSIRTSEEILKTFSTVVKGREDVLLGGTLILQQLLLIHKLNKVTVSSCGIRYGAIINFTNNLLKKKNTHQR